MIPQQLDTTPRSFSLSHTQLGVAGPHTYAPVGRVVEYGIAQALGVTGQDLFRFTPLLQDMATDPVFVQPLSRFRQRWAYANAYYTDFQVPGSTAAFLSSRGGLHRVLESPAPASDQVSIVLSVATDAVGGKVLLEEDDTVPLAAPTDESSSDDDASSDVASADDLATRLDRLGWTKHFVDLRSTLVTVANPFASKEETPPAAEPQRQYYSSSELWHMYTRFSTDRWHLPLGHSMLLANAKDEVNERFNAAGKPLMRQLAGRLVESIVE